MDENITKNIVEKIVEDNGFKEMDEKTKQLELLEKNNCVIGKNVFKEPVLRYPWKIDGKINWKNFIIGGSWGKFLGWMLFCVFILAASAAYNYDTSYYKSVTECYRDFPAMSNFTSYNTCNNLTRDYEIRIGVRDSFGNVMNIEDEKGMQFNY